MDDPTLNEQVAAFRYSLIAPIVSRQTPMLPGETTRQLQEIASRSYTIPGTRKTSISARSLERYITGYRKEGWDGLKPCPRSKTGGRSIRPELLEQAINLRRERPERSVEQLIYLLERSGTAAAGEIAASTLSRNLRQAGLSRQELLQENRPGYRRMEVTDVHIMWQADFQVWHEDVRYPDAVPLALARSVHKRIGSGNVKAKTKTDDEKHGQEISFFRLAEEKRRSAWAEEPLQFAVKDEVIPDGE